ncbi:hypothetical protein NDU88_006403 [Pleurodeles waltl]|uniref:Uncharacterized protein n=1 Tax=Pleurodeles waltl TaxID=8319 RepID=A0AAV7RLH3_PLEWA|nr:hypothetical protein NDU88_006403 [Pleurodeles waltl]
MAKRLPHRIRGGRANSVSSYLDDRGAGVTNENPDFRVLRGEKREDGRGVEGDAERGDGGPERKKEEKAPETPKGNPEEPNPTKNTEERGSPEAGGETPNRRHVPGGTWLAKCSSCAPPRPGRRHDPGGVGLQRRIAPRCISPLVSAGRWGRENKRKEGDGGVRFLRSSVRPLSAPLRTSPASQSQYLSTASVADVRPIQVGSMAVPAVPSPSLCLHRRGWIHSQGLPPSATHSGRHLGCGPPRLVRAPGVIRPPNSPGRGAGGNREICHRFSPPDSHLRGAGAAQPGSRALPAPPAAPAGRSLHAAPLGLSSSRTGQRARTKRPPGKEQRSLPD